MGQEGNVLTVEFTVMGIPCIGLNGGQASQCGWCKYRWGVSWQITPRALIAAISDPDPAAAIEAARCG
jgi:predicted 3-demethylubiquinone-9 3-methyltransferase (glyoxalase superfamily)